MPVAKSRLLSLLLFGFALLSICIASPTRARADVIASIDPLATPNYFTCEAEGSVNVPANTQYRWYVQIDGATVYSSDNATISGPYDIVAGGVYGSGSGGSTMPLHGTHTCTFYGVLHEPFPTGMVYAWYQTATYTFP